MNGKLTLEEFYKKMSSEIYRKVKLKYKKKDLDDRFSQVLHNSSFRFIYRKYQNRPDSLLTYQESEMELDKNLDGLVDEVLKGLTNVRQIDFRNIWKLSNVQHLNAVLKKQQSIFLVKILILFLEKNVLTL